MNFNTSDYFAYKRNKIQMDAEVDKKPISKFNFLFQLFIATFIIMFIIIVISIMKYSSKMDIEYTKGDLSMRNPDTVNNISGYSVAPEEEQRKIDNRLMLIQQEENAPSEARIITKDNNTPEVIDPIHIEKNIKIEKAEKKKQQLEEIKKISSAETKSDKKEITLTEPINKNVTIMSKVLIGRFATFEEAKDMQSKIKQNNPKLTPFVRKIGDVYCVQMGSYQDFNVAKNQAHSLKNNGFDVWIYQQ